MSNVVFYSEQDNQLLKAISETPNSTWRAQILSWIEKYAPMRSYQAVFAKVWSYTEAGAKSRKRSNKRAKNLKVKNEGQKTAPLVAVKKNAIRKHHSPHSAAQTMQVSQKELRFAYKSIRIENHEVVISF